MYASRHTVRLSTQGWTLESISYEKYEKDIQVKMERLKFETIKSLRQFF